MDISRWIHERTLDQSISISWRAGDIGGTQLPRETVVPRPMVILPHARYVANWFNPIYPFQLSEIGQCFSSASALMTIKAHGPTPTHGLRSIYPPLIHDRLREATNGRQMGI